ncbi:MAG: amidohydrolase family protein, partial [Clostridia bacterium]|nr:amidohydrolase family protein [Clostridia bacterium]
RCASQNNDMSPIELLEDYGFFDRKALAIHATNVSQRDIQILAKNSASVCANFGSNHKLASGVCPIYQITKYGVNVCLGTDGSASNNRLDMFREMYLASTSQNILLSDASCFESKDILKMATINGAKALGLEKVGTVEVGNYADLIMLNSYGVDAIIDHNLYDNLVYSYGTEDVLMTMVNGKVIYDNGKYNFSKSTKSILTKIEKIKEKFKR